MNTKRIQYGIGPLILLWLFVTTSWCRGASFTVMVDTSSLVGQSSSPFSLDFQFIDGSGTADGNNSVTLSGFNFLGGGWVGANPGTVTLTDTSFFSEFFQQITPGSSLEFTVSLTTSVDVGGTPDAFSFGILDNTLSEIPANGLGDSLVTVDIDSPNPTIQTFSTDLGRTPINIPAPQIEPASSVPDSGVSLGCVATLFFSIIIVGKNLNLAQQKQIV